jgi:hypothetical protein
LKERGYFFKYNDGWGNWPIDYLHNCISHYYTIELLQRRWASEAKGKKKSSNAAERIATAFTPQELEDLKKEVVEMSNMYELFEESYG